MIGLSAPVYDPIGAAMMRDLPQSTTSEIRRRVNRQKTLDGGVVVNDGGHAAGDRTLTYRLHLRGDSDRAMVSRLVKLYPLLNVTNREGMFRAAPQSFQVEGRAGVLVLLVTEQLG